MDDVKSRIKRKMFYCAVPVLVAIAKLSTFLRPTPRHYEIIDLASVAYDAGNLEEAEVLAQEGLNMNLENTVNGNSGNITHNCNQILGLIDLKHGRRLNAKKHLIEAGKSIGSPQLNSYGPKMVLARELLKLGEKAVVLEYLDLISKFMIRYDPNAEFLFDNQQEHLNSRREWMEYWKAQVRRGIVPNDKRWTVQMLSHKACKERSFWKFKK